MEKAFRVSVEIEVDESSFGDVRKGKRSRGAVGKGPVFGLLKRSGRVYTVMIPNARRDTVMPIKEHMAQPDNVLYTDCFTSYNESFNGKLRDELLNGEIFYSLKEAKIIIEQWRHHYNTKRPHSSLGYRPPAPETKSIQLNQFQQPTTMQ